MALDLTDAARLASQQLNVQPNIAFEIDGYDHKFGLAEIKKLIRIGDPDLFIGDDWTIGGYRVIDNQSAYMSFNTGTTTRISQQLSPDKGLGSSTSQMVISLVDKNQEISQLVAPGQILQDVLGRDASVSIGFVDTDVDRDYAIIFRGIIADIECGPGYINFVLTNTEEKKRKPITDPTTSKLVGAIGAGAITTLTLDDTTSFYNTVLGPDGNVDTAYEFYARIDDEYFIYTGKSGNTLTGVTRAQFSTTAIAHDDQADVASYIRLNENGLNLALKVMLSGWAGPCFSNVDVTNFNVLDPLNSVANCLFFDQINVKEKYGLAEGDYITTTGAANGANNVTLKVIQSIDTTEDGSYIVIDGVTFVDESNTAAVVAFRSQFDTLPVGLKMKTSEVDVNEHIKLRDRFLSIFQFDFLKSDVSDGKGFLEKQVYLPQACFSVPRKGRSSVAFHTGPIADTNLVTLSTDNVLNADKLRVRRSISKNFANTIVYSFNENRLDEKLETVKEYKDDEAILQIGDTVGKKILAINAEGMRTTTSAESRSLQSANRFLKRYKLGAEYILGVQVKFGDGYAMEIGDIVAVDYADLQLTDFATGTRAGEIKLMECMNKVLDQKTGEVTVDLTNTIFSTTDRFGLVSPSSLTDAGSTVNKLQLQRSWSTKPWQKESRKWKDYLGQHVIVHSADWTYNEQTTIAGFSEDGLTMLLSTPLPSAPPSGYIVMAPAYPSSSDPNEEYYWKSRHCSFAPQLEVVTGISSTQFTVSVGDAAKILVGAVFRVHNFDYTIDSPEVVVTDLTGVTVTVDTPLGFTPSAGQLVDLVGFLDGGYAYRYL